MLRPPVIRSWARAMHPLGRVVHPRHVIANHPAGDAGRSALPPASKNGRRLRRKCRYACRRPLIVPPCPTVICPPARAQDKGGDPAAFRKTQVAWEALRVLVVDGRLKDGKGSFADYINGRASAAAAGKGGDSDNDAGSGDDGDDGYDEEFYAKYRDSNCYPSYEFYEAAAEEEMPGYRVELAKVSAEDSRAGGGGGGFSSLVNEVVYLLTTPLVNLLAKECPVQVQEVFREHSEGRRPRWIFVQGDWHLRTLASFELLARSLEGPVRALSGTMSFVSPVIGRICAQTSSSPRRNGLTDPSDAAASLRDLIAMEEVLLTGVEELDEESQELFVRHCVDSDHWAYGGRKRKAIQADAAEGAAPSKAAKVASKSESASAASKKKGKGKKIAPSSSDVVSGSFTVLVPGVDGALNEKTLAGKTFVISGCFPEVGGGDADAVGVANAKTMIESFGGKVITRFSKNTSE